MALDLSVETTVLGTSSAWTLQDIEPGPQEPLLLTVDQKHTHRIDVDIGEHTDGFTCHVTVTTVTSSWRGKLTETVISRSELIAPLGLAAHIKQASTNARGLETAIVEMTLTLEE